MEHPTDTILHGDCIEQLNALPAGCADLVFADPPFNIGYEYDVYNDKQDRAKYLAWSGVWIAAVHRALKSDGTFWLAIGDEYAAELKIASQDLGFHCRSWVIWYYTFGVKCKYKFTRSHAHVFYFVKDPKSFTFRSEDPENRIPSARQLVYGDKRANPQGRLPDDTWIIPPARQEVSSQGTDAGSQEAENETQSTESAAAHPSEIPSQIPSPKSQIRHPAGPQPSPIPDTFILRPQDIESCFRADEDTWYFPRVAGTFKERAGFHGCQMPEQLLGRIIRTCSNVGDLVLDPFSGSATTLAVAKKLGRRYLGFDLSPEYVQQGLARLEATQVGDRLNGSPEPTASAPKTSEGRRLEVGPNGGSKRKRIRRAGRQREMW